MQTDYSIENMTMFPLKLAKCYPAKTWPQVKTHCKLLWYPNNVVVQLFVYCEDYPETKPCNLKRIIKEEEENKMGNVGMISTWV